MSHRARAADALAEDSEVRWIAATVPAGFGLLFSLLLGVLAASRAEAQEPTRAFAPDPAESCEGKEPGASCWMELADRPGCYTWNPNLAAGETVTWSGECSGGLAQGTGSRKWSHPDDEGVPLVSGGEGELRDGKRHGPWSAYYGNGGMAEGSYEHGQPVGPWTNVLADGTVFEGEWANGQRQGRWTLTHGDDVGGGFHAAGKRHGKWKLLFAANDNETVRGTAEGIYVAGNRNGLWVTRFDSGTIHEITWRHGVRHGPSSSRYASGAVAAGSYVEGEKDGYWTERSASGAEDSGEYRKGKKHGEWTERTSSDDLYTYTYVDGLKDGAASHLDSSGNLVWKGAYDKSGLKQGAWQEAYGDLDPEGFFAATGAGAYVDGRRHGRWQFELENGGLLEGSYANGKKAGRWARSIRGQNAAVAVYGDGKAGEWIRTGSWETHEGASPPFFYLDFSSGRPTRFVLEKGAYRDGKKHGKWTESGPKRGGNSGSRNVDEGTYRHGVRHGEWSVFRVARDTGDFQYSLEGQMRNGKWHGPRLCKYLYWDKSYLPEINKYVREHWEYFLDGEEVTQKQWKRWDKQNN